jgi:hypothetical protein
MSTPWISPTPTLSQGFCRLICLTNESLKNFHSNDGTDLHRCRLRIGLMRARLNGTELGEDVSLVPWRSLVHKSPRRNYASRRGCYRGNGTSARPSFRIWCLVAQRTRSCPRRFPSERWPQIQTFARLDLVSMTSGLTPRWSGRSVSRVIVGSTLG